MSTRKAPELLGRAASSFGAALLAVLVPKCPLCIAAYLATFGLGATAAHGAALFVRPIVFTLAGVALFSLALGAWRSRKRRATPSCCRHLSGC
jgi:hypothetical protein